MLWYNLFQPFKHNPHATRAVVGRQVHNLRVLVH